MVVHFHFLYKAFGSYKAYGVYYMCTAELLRFDYCHTLLLVFNWYGDIDYTKF